MMNWNNDCDVDDDNFDGYDGNDVVDVYDTAAAVVVDKDDDGDDDGGGGDDNLQREIGVCNYKDNTVWGGWQSLELLVYHDVLNKLYFVE